MTEHLSQLKALVEAFKQILPLTLPDPSKPIPPHIGNDLVEIERIATQALTHAPELLKWCEDLETALSKLRPFSVVQGDAVNRLNPSSQLKVNSNDAWIVSEGNRSAHKLIPLVMVLNGENPPKAGE